MRNRSQTPSVTPASRLSLRFWNTLAFRLAVTLNLTVLVVFGVSTLLDFRRERAVHVGEEIERLREEGKVMAVAQTQLTTNPAFQRYIDSFCRQMSSDASPGHHILVVDEDGNPIARAHERGDPDLETRMLKAWRGGAMTFEHDGEKYLSVGVPTAVGSIILVGQSLEPIEKLLRAQRNSRIGATTVLVGLIAVVTTLSLLLWVRRPLQELVRGVGAVGRGEFDRRLAPQGSAELGFLADGFNSMVGSLERAEKRRQTEMARAQLIQQRLLPRATGAGDAFEVAAAFLPTESVGGDLYDIIPLPDGSTLFAVIDVSGHGVGAALCTALLRTVLHHQAALTTDTTCVAGAMNRELAAIIDPGSFATCFLARITDSADTIEYVVAGHDPAVVIRADHRIDTLAGSDLPLGVEPTTIHQARSAELHHGDRLFIFTDGLHEAFDESGIILGRDRLAKHLLDTAHLPPQEQVDTVLNNVRAFQHSPTFDDDVTLLCIRRNGANHTQ